MSYKHTLIMTESTIDYTAIVRQLLTSHHNDAISVVIALMEHRNAHRTIKLDGGYCVYEQSDLSFPVDFLGGCTLAALRFDRLVWQVVLQCASTGSLFLFMLSLCLHPSMASYKEMHTIQQHVRDVTTSGRVIVDLLRAGRSDLQTVVGKVAYHVVARLGSFTATDAFLLATSRTPWHVDTGSKFYAHLKHVCHNAAVVSMPSPDAMPCSVVLDHSGRLLMSERDHILVAVLLLFSEDTAYVTKSLAECTRDGVPCQLASDLRKEFPAVFETGPVSTPAHFL